MIAARSTKSLMLAIGVLAATVIGGCSTREPDLTNGRALFNANCASCHKLAEARAAGILGPDLDAAFQESRASGMDGDTIAGVVQAQIENPRTPENGLDAASLSRQAMPANLVEGDDADDVAAYVGSVAGVPGIEPPPFVVGTYFAETCGGCHALAAANTSGAVGPDLDAVLPGQDEAQILESIVNPTAQVSSGYPDGVMPTTYGVELTEDQQQELVQYLLQNVGG